MRTVARDVASVAIGLSGIVLAGVGLNHMLDIGSCASGGPYAVARACPEDLAAWFWLPVAGVLAWVVGLLVSSRPLFEPGAGQALWTVGFAGGGTALLVKVLIEPSMPSDSKLGASIVAAVFIPMGLAVGVVGLLQLVARQDRRNSGSRWAAIHDATGTVRTPKARLKARLKALNDLRSTGALTRAEFETLRADLAGSGPAVDRVALIRQLADQRASGVLSTEQFEAGKHTVMSAEEAGGG